MTKKQQEQLKRAELKRIQDERKVLAKCVAKGSMGPKVNGIQI